jgi:1-deoxyxylulose-5-phosphate synthase
MEHANLGRTGLVVSRVCLGTMTFGLQCDEPTSRAILDKAAAGGVTFLDTADVYPHGGGLDTVGRTEEILGRWLAGQRANFVVATKCVARVGPNPWDQGMSRKHVLDAIDASLRRLGTDYVDLYQLHAYDPTTPLDEALDALDTVVRSGRARYVGVSKWPAYKVARALGRSEALGTVRIDSVQPRYNLVSRRIEQDLLPLCVEEGIGVIPFNPLAGGLLTGKHDRAAVPQAGTRFALARGYKDFYWHDRQFDVVDELRRLADEAGMSPTTLAVAWVLATPGVTSAIVGASRPEQLDDSLAAAAQPIDPEPVARLDELTAEWRWRPDAPPAQTVPR